MSDRITAENVRTAWALYVMACKRAGFDVEGWFLEEGSASSGDAFRSYQADRFGTAGCPERGFLGRSRKEAYDALHRMVNLMAAVALLRADQ